MRARKQIPREQRLELPLPVLTIPKDEKKDEKRDPKVDFLLDFAV